MNKKVLVTGSAGFIGFHLSKRLSETGWEVVGIDNINNYYDVKLKKDRLEKLKFYGNFKFYKLDLKNREKINELFEKEKFDFVVNLAAQAGVRYSLINPYSYIDSNISGFLNILEGCRNFPIKHLIYASSSSVYGGNKKMPFSVHDNVDHPVSLYAASKKSNELMAHTYSSLFKIPVTGLRFFTVYGPWGRPDMAAFLFTKAIIEGKEIDVYNKGKMKRDFTYIDDIVEGICKVILCIPEPNKNWDGEHPDNSSSFAPYRLFNIGNNRPVELMEFIEILEKTIGKKAKKKFLPMQPGDVPETYADINDLTKTTGFKPVTNIEEGLNKFVKWFIEYYKINI
ncbi:MAG TPA: NAD-dependent epimerase [Ignavibacteriaceae bacterium]|nr:NAD-dependent epimerase [Ignavibacteriaceae bacterium]